MSFEVGQTVGDYEIAGVLGTGGMGAVYRVRHTISDRMEAMKVLLPDLLQKPDLGERFLREIKIQASLSHPNIASLYTVTRVDNRLLMFMELVEGITLAERLQQGTPDLSEGVDYIRQVLAALVYAHGRGVIHRDIKPANMLLTESGNLKLTDFGLASTAHDRRLTRSGTIVGSLYYMAPEQIKSQPPDARSDIYSTGVTLYELATGARPFQADSDYALMSAHLLQPPAPPREVNNRVPTELSKIILRALEKDPERRFQTAHEFLACLDAARNGSTVAPQPIKTAVHTGVARWAPDQLERIRKEFAVYIGPMARILVDRAAKQAADIEELYRLLASEIPAEKDRRKFLDARPR